MENPDVVSRILHDMKSDSWTVRSDAVCRIGNLDNPQDLTRLLEQAKSEKWFIREMIAAGIRMIKNHQMAESLEYGLVAGDDCIRDACARSLGSRSTETTCP